MDLENVAAVIRPRSPWEAIDLGFGMVRAWWRPVGSAWLITVAPVWCLLFLLLSGKPGLALFLLWWLRPLFDRVPLHVVSRRLFGDPPAPGEVAADLPQLWGRDLLAALTLQRLDPARSFHLPVGQLEGLTGTARKRRTALLDHSGRASAIWLTAACSLLELVTIFGLLGLIGLLSPQGPGVGAALRTAASEGTMPYGLGLVIGALSFLAFLIIEPFYVAAGFSLYLTRRTMLEGWDVEISFRRLAARLAGSRSGRAAVVLLVLAFGGVTIAEGAVPSTPATTADPSEVVHRVLASPDFRTHEKVSTWRLKKSSSSRSSKDREAAKVPPRPGVSLPTEAISAVALFVGGVVLVVLGVLFFRVIRDWLRRAPKASKVDADPLPEAVFGLDIRPESLPPDVPAAAWAAWERGDPAAALGLLYRGALACLVHRDGLEVAASWTEGDCLAVVRRRAASSGVAPGVEYFARLTRAWQSTAYAHRPPGRDEAQALCAAWGQHFESIETARREVAA
jgi:hypothetical protein